MRRALLVCAAITFAIACTDNITEPVVDRASVAPGTTSLPGTVAFATTTTEDGLSISTDKDDYQPGDVVHLTGYGWPANDVLDIVLTDDPLTHDPHRWSVSVGQDGTFLDDTYTVDEGDLFVTFTLVATSRATGRSLTVIFTDGVISNATFALFPAGSPTGTPPNGCSAVSGSSVASGTQICALASFTITQQGNSDTPAGIRWRTPSGNVVEVDVRSPNFPGNATGSQAFSAGFVPTMEGTWTVLLCESSNSNLTGAGATGCVGAQRASATFTVTAANVAPVVDAGGPYSGNRNVAISLGGATATDGDGDALAYAWTYAAVSGVPAGTTCSFSDAAVLNPTFTCTNVGVFKVTLTVNDGNGHIVADDAEVTVANGAPTADAGPATYNGTEGSPVALNGSATDPDNDALTYKWTAVAGAGVDAGATCSFDDDTKADAKVTCTDDGTFKLTLTAKDPDNLTGTDVADLVLTNVKPNASAGGPPGPLGYSGNEGSPIQLDGTGDDPGDNDDAHLIYKWTVNTAGIDAGGACAFDNDAIEDPKITCTDDSNLGQFTLSLVVTDDEGAISDAGTAKLSVNNVKPVANAGGGTTGYSGDEGSAIQLAGSADDPGDNDDPHLSYQWTVNTAGIDASGTCTFDDDNKKDAKVSCTDDSDNAAGGSFKLTLIASDDEGNASIESYAKLTVTNAGPVANAGPDYTGSEGSPVQLQGSVTDAGTNDTHVWLWKYVAGPGVDAGATCSFSPSAAAEDPTITCTDDGTVELTLKVKDDDGAESSDVATLTLTNVDPVANAGPATYTGVEGSPVQLQGSVQDAGGNDTHTWYWKYVNGTTVDAGATCSFYPNASAEDPTITCTDDGAVELTLKVTDDDGGSGSDVATLNLTNAAPVANAGGGATGYSGGEGSAISLTGAKTDAGANDTHTYLWTYTPVSGVDANATCSFTNANALSASVSCTDDGSFKVTLKVTDDDLDSHSADAVLTVSNENPTATAGTYNGTEGSAIPLAGTESDAGSNDVRTVLWTYAAGSGVDAGASCSITNATALNASINCNDDGTYQLTLTVTDDDGGIGTSTGSLTVANAAPVIASFTKSDGSSIPTTVFIGATLNLKTVFTDAGSHDTHKAQIDCGSGYADVDGSGDDASPALMSCSFPSIGTKTIKVKVADDDGDFDEETRTILVAYNFSGFSAPVDRPSIYNVSKAGQAVPLKWRLTDANGNGVTDLTSVSIQAVGLSCSQGTTQDQLEEYAAGTSGLQNLGDGYYQFNWKTPVGYAGSCKSIALVFGAGGLSYVEGPHAYFTFKK